jgi:hypothetical protein
VIGSRFLSEKDSSSDLSGQANSDRRTLWLQLAGLKWAPASSKGMNTDTVQRGLIMSEAREIEEI